MFNSPNIEQIFDFFRMVSWSPVGSSLVFVAEDNNLYYRKDQFRILHLKMGHESFEIMCSAHWMARLTIEFHSQQIRYPTFTATKNK
jgi:hypothetical protein